MADRVRWRPGSGITRTRGASRSTGPSMSGIMRAPGVGQVGGGGLPPVGDVVSEESWSSSPSPAELREILYRDAEFMDLGNQAPGVTNPFDQITPAMRIHPDDLNRSGEVNVTDFIMAGQRPPKDPSPSYTMGIPGSVPDRSRMDPATWGYGHIPGLYPHHTTNKEIKAFESLSKGVAEQVEANPDYVPTSGKYISLRNKIMNPDYVPTSGKYISLRNKIINAGIKEGLYRSHDMPEVGQAAGESAVVSAKDLGEYSVGKTPRWHPPIGNTEPGRGGTPGYWSYRTGGKVVRSGYFQGGEIAPGGLGEILTQETAVETPLGDTFTEETITPYGESFAEETVTPGDPGMVFEMARAAVEDKLSGVELSPEASMAADEAINAFVAQNGEEELGALVAAVQAELSGEEIPGGEEMFAEEEVYESPDGLIEQSMGVLGEAQGFRHGGAIRGPGDGMSDSISASIDRAEPIAVSSGETIIPADAVSALGNGSTDAGAKQLMDMVDRIRMAKTGSSRQPRSINPRRSLIA